MLMLVPISITGALVLASAAGFVDDDITFVRLASLARSDERVST